MGQTLHFHLVQISIRGFCLGFFCLKLEIEIKLLIFSSQTCKSKQTENYSVRLPPPALGNTQTSRRYYMPGTKWYWLRPCHTFCGISASTFWLNWMTSGVPSVKILVTPTTEVKCAQIRFARITAPTDLLNTTKIKEKKKKGT